MSQNKDNLKDKLTPEEYYVTQNHGTEPAFSGKYDSNKMPGTYHCVVCGSEIFSSKEKYDSGSGWPSFFEQLSPDAITTEVDKSHGMVRIEIMCAKCDAHLGHVFDDGPKPTGKRYCVNSLSINYEEVE